MWQILEMFGDVQSFLHALEDRGLATRRKKLDILLDPTKKSKLLLELAATVDGGKPLVEATYLLEGDGPLALSCYKRVDTLLQSIRVAHFPNTSQVVNQLTNGEANAVALTQQYTHYAKSCVQPGFDYLQEKFYGDLNPAVTAFKAARLFCPHQVKDLQPNARDVESISAFPFLSDALDDLKTKLPQYLANAADTAEDVGAMEWWKRHAIDLPQWSKAASLILLVQPSSAAAERVFSLLNTFSSCQDSSLEDYIESSIMLQYNKH